MKWFGWVLAIVIIAVGAWFDWTYHSIRTEVTDLGSRIPSEEGLDRLTPEQSAETLKAAESDCLEVDQLAASSVARLVRGKKVAKLAEQCQLIRARKGSLEGP
jgi:hypothetical protein